MLISATKAFLCSKSSNLMFLVSTFFRKVVVE